MIPILMALQVDGSAKPSFPREDCSMYSALEGLIDCWLCRLEIESVLIRGGSVVSKTDRHVVIGVWQEDRAICPKVVFSFASICSLSFDVVLNPCSCSPIVRLLVLCLFSASAQKGSEDIGFKEVGYRLGNAVFSRQGTMGFRSKAGGLFGGWVGFRVGECLWRGLPDPELARWCAGIETGNQRAKELSYFRVVG